MRFEYIIIMVIGIIVLIVLLVIYYFNRKRINSLIKKSLGWWHDHILPGHRRLEKKVKPKMFAPIKKSDLILNIGGRKKRRKII